MTECQHAAPSQKSIHATCTYLQSSERPMDRRHTRRMQAPVWHQIASVYCAVHLLAQLSAAQPTAVPSVPLGYSVMGSILTYKTNISNFYSYFTTTTSLDAGMTCWQSLLCCYAVGNPCYAAMQAGHCVLVPDIPHTSARPAARFTFEFCCMPGTEGISSLLQAR